MRVQDGEQIESGLCVLQDREGEDAAASWDHDYLGQDAYDREGGLKRPFGGRADGWNVQWRQASADARCAVAAGNDGEGGEHSGSRRPRGQWINRDSSWSTESVAWQRAVAAAGLRGLQRRCRVPLWLWRSDRSLPGEHGADTQHAEDDVSGL